MQYNDIRLEAFLPGLLVPPETGISLTIGFALLTISIYSLTWQSLSGLYLRLAIGPLAMYYFWEYGFGPYETPGVQVDVGLAVVGLYGIMRVLETTFVSLMDEQPPHWIVEGKEAPIPETTLGRMAYAVDLATSLRGNSWFSKTHWDWAPRTLVNSPTRLMSRTQFLGSAGLSLVPLYLVLDIFDSINKSRTWDKSTVYPITSLPWHEQLVFSTSVCAQTALSIIIPYTLISVTFVLLGSHPESWPPMFNAPFTSTSLADFWTRRWHAIFRRVFERLSSALLFVLPIRRSSPPSIVQRTIRALVIFGLSATLHILLMYRVDMRETEYPGTFFDLSILKFFLSQPLGLVLEISVVLPVCDILLPSRWRDTVTRAWTWAFLVWAGRFWSDVWIHRGFWDEQERVVGWSVVRGVLYGKWAV